MDLGAGWTYYAESGDPALAALSPTEPVSLGTESVVAVTVLEFGEAEVTVVLTSPSGAVSRRAFTVTGATPVPAMSTSLTALLAMFLVAPRGRDAPSSAVA